MKTDIWSLGCVLYELAFGNRLFPSDFPAFQYYTCPEKQLSVPTTVLTKWSHSAQKNLSQVILMCLDRNPVMRPSAEHISEMMEHFQKEVDETLTTEPLQFACAQNTSFQDTEYDFENETPITESLQRKDGLRPSGCDTPSDLKVRNINIDQPEIDTMALVVPLEYPASIKSESTDDDFIRGDPLEDDLLRIEGIRRFLDERNESKVVKRITRSRLCRICGREYTQSVGLTSNISQRQEIEQICSYCFKAISWKDGRKVNLLRFNDH
jgi:serine/threonine protein kinase